MLYKFGPLFGFVAFALVAFCYLSFFIVPEGKQAVVFQFDRIIEPAIKDSGLHFKFPWRNVELFEKRIINWDGSPNEVPTREKNNIIVDTTARYRIVDPVVLRRELGRMGEVNLRFGEVIKGATNQIIAENDLVETVRNTNDIIKRSRPSENESGEKGESDELLDELEAEKALDRIATAEISGDLEKIERGREALTQDIVNEASAALTPYGIELVDIQLKRVALEKSVEQEVFNRMITERQRIVAKIKSVGVGRKKEIEGETEEEVQRIASEAYKEEQRIKGEAEAKAFEIYADAFSKDEKFYDFYRSIQAYKEGLREDSTLILSADADFVKLLRNGPEAFFRE